MEEKSKTSVVLWVGVILFLLVLSFVKAEAAAKPEGTLTIAVPTLGEEGFLPDRNTAGAAAGWECVYDYLIYYDSIADKPRPGAAERWEYSKDGLSLTFNLRKGIQFHDGWGELTAEDVKFTIEHNKSPASTNITKSTMDRVIKSMEVKDRYTLVIHLKDPSPAFWLNFTADAPNFPILCKKYIETVGEEKANRQPIGSGPYRFVESKLGAYSKFEALEQHWLVVPEFKYVIVRVVPEETTRVAMLKTGEVDIAAELEIDKLPELENAKLKPHILKNGLTIYLVFGGMLLPEDKRYVGGYHLMDPWKDIRVREAMNIAIDRNALVKTFFRGIATAAPIAAALPGWDQLKPIPYDPKRAKQLLAEAGYPNGFSLKFVAHTKQPILPLLAGAVAGYWEAIGIKTEIIPGDYATWRVTNKSGKTAGYVWGNVMGNFIEWPTWFSQYELPNASTPFWQSKETTAAYKKVLGEVDPKKREAYVIELGQVYRSLYSHVPLVYAPRIHAANTRVGEWPPNLYGSYQRNFVFIQHAKPLNTYRLFKFGP